MSTQTVIPQPQLIEHFVSPEIAAEFLCMERRLLLDWARRGKVPGHPLGEGQRCIWRFLLSELAEWVKSQHNSNTPGASKKKARIQ